MLHWLTLIIDSQTQSIDEIIEKSPNLNMNELIQPKPNSSSGAHVPLFEDQRYLQYHAYTVSLLYWQGATCSTSVADIKDGSVLYQALAYRHPRPNQRSSSSRACICNSGKLAMNSPFPPLKNFLRQASKRAEQDSKNRARRRRIAQRKDRGVIDGRHSRLRD